MAEILSFDDLGKIERLNDSEWKYFDYIDSLSIEADQFIVTCFIEPCGAIDKRGGSFAEVLEWWLEVCSIAPDPWVLKDLHEKGQLPATIEDLRAFFLGGVLNG